MKYFLATIAILTLASISATGVARRRQSRPALGLCELVDNWQKYNGRKVRARAFYRVRDKGTGLYDPACKEGELLTDVAFRNGAKGAIKKLDQIVDNRKHAQVILEGIFHGPEPLADDPKLPTWLRQKMKESQGWRKRYGHMDGYDTQIEVTKVVEVSEAHTR